MAGTHGFKRRVNRPISLKTTKSSVVEIPEFGWRAAARDFRSTGGWFRISMGLTKTCFIHFKIVLSLLYKTYNRAMEHTRFLLLTHKKHFCVEVVSSRIETVRKRIAECTSRNTCCVLLSFTASFQIFLVPEWHQNKCTWKMPTLSLPSFPTMYFPYSQSGIICVFRVSYRNSTTSLHVEIFKLLPADWDSKFHF